MLWSNPYEHVRTCVEYRQKYVCKTRSLTWDSKSCSDFLFSSSPLEAFSSLTLSRHSWADAEVKKICLVDCFSWHILHSNLELFFLTICTWKVLHWKHRKIWNSWPIVASEISSKQDIRYGSGGALWLAFNPAVPASENSWNNYVTFSLAGLVFARLAQVHSFTVQVSRKSTD